MGGGGVTRVVREKRGCVRRTDPTILVKVSLVNETLSLY